MVSINLRIETSPTAFISKAFKMEFQGNVSIKFKVTLLSPSKSEHLSFHSSCISLPEHPKAAKDEVNARVQQP